MAIYNFVRGNGNQMYITR